MARRVSREIVHKGETLFDAGEEATEIFFVLSGSMQVTVPRFDGTVNSIATVGSGATFGCFPEVVMLRGATVTAVSKNEEFCIKNEELCFKNEEFCIKNYDLCR